jgi:hypothetical protein
MTPDGKPNHVVPVQQLPLRSALEGLPPPSGVQSLARFLNRIDRPQLEVSARTFELLKEYEPLQQRVSQLVGHKANTVTGTLVSGGAAAQRLRMADAQTLEYGQYSLPRAKGTVQYGSGVCVTVNNVLFRTTAEKASRRELGRLPSPGTPMFRHPASQQMPVYFQHNDHHGYVRIGDTRDPRQAADAIMGDVWDDLPIVKTWSNFSEANIPAWTKSELRPGEALSPENSLASFAAIEQERVDDRTIDGALLAHGMPPAGGRLVISQYEKLRQTAPGERGLYHEPSLALQPTLSYRNAETGEVFIPSVALHDFQQARLAMAHPMYGRFVALANQLA